jgi:hypothetical protein
MRAFASWLLYHLTILGALFAASTLLGLLFGAGFFAGGASFEQALSIAHYLCLVLIFPSGLLWISHVVRDARTGLNQTEP